jgi:methyltransferase (TIGR00027 family)
MIDGRPSMTARRVAMRRAAHQLFDSPLVFEDPLAVRILGPETAATLSDDCGNPPERRLRAFMVARSRYAEDQLRAAVARGARQYVLLGAGLDTFAYRNPFPRLRVFEVDHPASQAWKRQCLEAAAIPIPANLRFTPVDFNKQNWDEELRQVGFAANQPTFFAWLGVTPYLTKDAVFSTLRQIHALSPENGVVFDYALPRASLNEQEQAAHDAMAARVTAAGEPFQGYFEPEEFARELRSIGYGSVEDLDAADIDARFFAGRADRLALSGRIAHLLCAVGARGEVI